VKSSSSLWVSLNGAQRAGLLIGVFIIFLSTIGLGYWALHDPYVPVASQMPAERLAAAAKLMDVQKIPYRVSASGNVLEVPESRLGKARLLMSGNGAASGGGVGLEIFGEADFSMTEFAQKVNFQRALQGELTRTIQAMDGIRSARVHVVLAEGGVLKRSVGKASAAITLSMQDGGDPAPAQVRGIQRLVAASVPEIRPDAVTVLNDAGVSLSRRAISAEEDYSGDQLGMKREVDEYLQKKLLRLLTELAPNGHVTASVDALLDFKQLKATTEQPIAVPKDDPNERATGVVVRERQTQRTSPAGQGKSMDGHSEDTGWEFDYKVGHRVEQSLSLPGAIKRLSVAVAMHGALAGVEPSGVEQLVGNAIGMDRSRGDAITVVFLPASDAAVMPVPATASAPVYKAEASGSAAQVVLAIGACLVLGLMVAIGLLLKRQQALGQKNEPVDVDAVTARVRGWLGESV
jgi:flagellar M-ring protein FliF